MLKRLSCAGIVLLIGSLAVQAGYAADKWISIRSKNFLLVGNASESAIRRVGRNLEEFRAGFATLFPAIGKQDPPPITVVVFKDDASFRPFKPLYQGKPANISGFFQAGEDVNFIALTADTQTPHVIYHEFVHALTKDATVPFPAWASEGLAEFYGTFEIDGNGKEMLLGRPMDEHIITLRQGFLPVRSLFAVDHDSPIYNEGTKQGIFYAESWAVMHYLMLGDNFKRQPQLSKFLALLGTGRPIEESFTEAFQTEYASFEKELQTYIGRFAFPAVRIKLQDKIDFGREMQLASITEAEAQYYLGDLLLHMAHYDVAETQLKKSIALDSKLAPAYASLGMLHLRQGHPEEALKAMTQAVQADSKNHMAHYYYAYLLQTVKDGGAADNSSRYKLMREHLKRTIEMAPGYLNAYDMLGYVALMLSEELTETEDLLKKALNASPGRRQVRLRLAELMIANKEPLPARVILTPLLDADDEQVRRHARSLMDNVKTYLENEQAYRDYQERLRQFEKERAAAELARPANADTTTREEPDGPPTVTRKPTQGGGDSSVVETAKVQLKRPAGQQIEGALLSVDCSRGLTLRVRVGHGNVELHADDPSGIEFLSFTTAVSDSFACGPAKSEPPVLIVYRRGGDPRYLGEPIRVEFIEKK